MSHTKQQIANWILGQWADDYFKFNYIKADFQVLDFQRVGNSLKVQYRFVADETQNGNENDSLVMFRFEPDSYTGVFPAQLLIVTNQDVYTWDSSDECEALAEGYVEEDSDASVEAVDWDDPSLSDEVVDLLLSNADHDAIADTLINLFDAKTKMPDFVPDRLKAHFSKIMNDFKS